MHSTFDDLTWRSDTQPKQDDTNGIFCHAVAFASPHRNQRKPEQSSSGGFRHQSWSRRYRFCFTTSFRWRSGHSFDDSLRRRGRLSNQGDVTTTRNVYVGARCHALLCNVRTLCNGQCLPRTMCWCFVSYNVNSFGYHHSFTFRRYVFASRFYPLRMFSERGLFAPTSKWRLLAAVTTVGVGWRPSCPLAAK